MIIPNIWENKIDVPNHQPVLSWDIVWCFDQYAYVGYVAKSKISFAAVWTPQRDAEKIHRWLSAQELDTGQHYTTYTIYGSMHIYRIT